MATTKNVREKPPLPMPINWRDAVPNDRLAHVIKDAQRAMARGLQIRLMEHSVSLGHWPFLRILWERDGLTQRELSELAGLREPTAYSALQAMEKLGYITRRKLPDNMRNICVYLTPKGKALQKTLIPLAEDLHEVAVRNIPPRTLAQFRKTLHTIIKNLEDDEIEKERRMPPSRKLG
ncbi:MarR family winged helix-turn-helix transcriptional regulator [Paraburkholderia sp. NPDC080076]|jgi:DNA-binding MarR family transcriptional regulator|uniref:MarR family winged helix-turn-helix transcriptional regulator n=1 Tax=Paraburkholderia sp. NPDC080076 TaxID=3390605 RepID=UPI003D049445